MNNLGISSRASKLASILVASLVACGACAEEDPAGPAMSPTGSSTPGPSTAPPATTPAPTMPMPTATMPMMPPPGPLPDPNEIEEIPAATGEAPAAYTTICSVCHGPGGAGVASLGPELRHVPAGYREHVVRMGRDGNPDLLLPMSPYDEASVSDADLEAIFAWLDSQPMPMTGQGLYADLCANCHGVDADGVPEKDLLALLDKIPAAVRSGFNPDQMANAAEYMPAWTAEQLTDAQIQLIVGYLTAVAAQ